MDMKQKQEDGRPSHSSKKWSSDKIQHEDDIDLFFNISGIVQPEFIPANETVK